MNTFNKKALTHGPWSISKLSVAQQCNYRFDLQYVKKIKQHRIVDPRGRIGNAAHKALELYIKGRDLSTSMKRAAIDERLTMTEADDLLAYRPSISAFMERFAKFKKGNPHSEELVEYKFGLTRDFTPVKFFDKDVFLRGVWDLALHLTTPAFIIIDHKSGERAPIDKYQIQLKTYAVSAHALRPDTEGVQTAIHFIKTQDIDWSDFIPTDTIKRDLIPWLIDYINSCADNVTDIPTPEKGWYCGFCGYKNICPEWSG
jgi:CRISPR/Cas system-associated exonuclease Cas4 (RecB family)